MDKTKSNWDNIYNSLGEKAPILDDWLEKYLPFINKGKDIPIIDLGCGFGNDTLYLSQRGFSVVSCDYSKMALARLKHFIEKPNCCCLDMRDKLPFKSDSAKIIICDLSIHYFNEKTTKALIEEISRVLTLGGMLICRVNSIDELRTEREEIVELERNYYMVGDKKKRYFDRKDVQHLFSNFEISDILDYEMKRYKNPKKVLEFTAIKQI